MKSMLAYQKRINDGKDVYSLKVTSIKKLTILNCNLNSILYESFMENVKSIEEFIEINPNVWIKNVFVMPNAKIKMSRSFFS